MANAVNPQIVQDVIADLSIEFRSEPTFDVDVLAAKVRNVVREAKMRRNYIATSYTDLQIEDDLYNMYSTIVDVSRFDYNKVGAEGEDSHSENGVSRTYRDRDSLWGSVHPFVKIL